MNSNQRTSLLNKQKKQLSPPQEGNEASGYVSPLQKLQSIQTTTTKDSKEEPPREGSEEKTERLMKERTQNKDSSKEKRSRSRNNKKHRRLAKKKHQTVQEHRESKRQQQQKVAEESLKPKETTPIEVKVSIALQKQLQFKTLVDELLSNDPIETNAEPSSSNEANRVPEDASLSFSKDSSLNRGQQTAQREEVCGRNDPESPPEKLVNPSQSNGMFGSRPDPYCSSPYFQSSRCPERDFRSFQSSGLPYMPIQTSSSFYYQNQLNSPFPHQYFDNGNVSLPQTQSSQPPRNSEDNKYSNHPSVSISRNDKTPPVRSERERYFKTRLCFDFKMGRCNRSKEDCTFAHGEDDIRKPKSNNLCRNFTKGFCKKSDSQCKFVHVRNSPEDIKRQEVEASEEKKLKEPDQEQRGEHEAINTAYMTSNQKYAYYPFMSHPPTSFYDQKQQTAPSHGNSQPYYQYPYPPPSASYYPYFYPPQYSYQQQGFSQATANPGAAFYQSYPGYNDHQSSQGEGSFPLQPRRSAKLCELGRPVQPSQRFQGRYESRRY